MCLLSGGCSMLTLPGHGGVREIEHKLCSEECQELLVSWMQRNRSLDPECLDDVCPMACCACGICCVQGGCEVCATPSVS